MLPGTRRPRRSLKSRPRKLDIFTIQKSELEKFSVLIDIGIWFKSRLARPITDSPKAAWSAIINQSTV